MPNPAALAGMMIVVAVLVAFEPVRHNDFVSLDDGLYVTANAFVQEGLSGSGVAWAFTASDASNWHPATWLSHMLDVQLFGLDPRGHHATSVLLHAVTALLLLLFLERTTGALWPAAFAALLFAVHPLRVESVAWAAERKDVLSGLLAMATLLAYLRWTRHPSWSGQLLLGGVYALGLMAKPMLVTLPFALLLLDHWPLRRLASAAALRPRIVEKAPLFVLAAISCAITLVVQSENLDPGGWSGNAWPLTVRVENAIVAYARYLGLTLWPAGLAALYPHPGASLSAFQVGGAAVLLALITAAVVSARRGFPYLLVGWLWYLGTLVPVIGLVQVGHQALADRYSYLPAVGLAWMVSFGVADLAARLRLPSWLPAAAGALAVLTLIGTTRAQVPHWQSSTRLYERAIAVTEANALAHAHLGAVLLDRGRDDDAIAELRRALAVEPGLVHAHYNLGVVYESRDRDTAIAHYEQALDTRPDFPWAHYNLANLRGRRGELTLAERHYREALAALPDFADAHYGLGVTLLLQDRPDDAREHFARSGRPPPDLR